MLRQSENLVDLPSYVALRAADDLPFESPSDVPRAARLLLALARETAFILAPTSPSIPIGGERFFVVDLQKSALARTGRAVAGGIWSVCSLALVTDSKVRTREAGDADLAWCVATDGHLDEAELVSKIRAHEILVAEWDGVLAGLLRFDMMWSAVPFIAQLRVLEAYRRQGVGHALLRAVEERARERGSIAVMSSIALGSDRTAALRWHAAMGFDGFGVVDGMFAGEQAEAFHVKVLER